MKIFKSYVTYLLFLMVLSSCTKVIDLNLGNNTGELVIEGNLTNVAGPQAVKLSKNVSFSTSNTYPPVTGATVTVSDQAGNKYAFTEGPSGTYTVNGLAGMVGNTYTMAVSANAKTYTASSVMPAQVTLDSLTSKNDEFNTSKHKKVITVYYRDPVGVANQYRFVMYVNNVQAKDVYVFNDQFNDGRYVSIDLREDDSSNGNDTGIFAGDTVTVEMQCIDEPIYTYWYTLMQQENNGPGGGVTPSNPPTNITPVTLGYFSAHTTQRKTIVVKN
ncbi:MAG TPA: DUF4249 domain-containing protein [Mucilaginibacter sp.]